MVFQKLWAPFRLLGTQSLTFSSKPMSAKTPKVLTFTITPQFSIRTDRLVAQNATSVPSVQIMDLIACIGAATVPVTATPNSSSSNFFPRSDWSIPCTHVYRIVGLRDVTNPLPWWQQQGLPQPEIGISIDHFFFPISQILRRVKKR